MIKPRGYRRHREKAGPSKIISASANLLPRRVYTLQVKKRRGNCIISLFGTVYVRFTGTIAVIY